jgi:hypothetical protein
VGQRFDLRRRSLGIGGGRRIVMAEGGEGRGCLSVSERVGDDGCRLAGVRLFGRFGGVRAGTGAVSLIREESDMLGTVGRSCNLRSRVWKF